MISPPSGRIVFDGQDVSTLRGVALKAFRERAQMVFQDPYSSLSPRMRIQDAMTEPLEIHGIGTSAEQREKAAEMLKRVRPLLDDSLKA